MPSVDHGLTNFRKSELFFKSLHHGNNGNPLTITNYSKSAHDLTQSLTISENSF